MMAASRHMPEPHKPIQSFMDECLEEAKGYSASFGKILAAFERWWEQHGQGVRPGPKTLTQCVGSRFQRAKSNISVYRNCRLRTE
jgi:hypothetical protein